MVLAVLLVPTHAVGGSAQGDMERRLEALEQQVQALQAEIAALKATVPSPPGGPPPAIGPTPAPQPPTGISALTTAPSGGDQLAPAQLPVYGGQTAGRLLNPDVGMIGNFIGAVGKSQGGSEAVAPIPFMTLQESEASFQAVVDPYARADFFLAIGEEGIEVEEGFVTFPMIPGRLLIKAGRFRADFGRLNAFHNHALPWIDRPLVMYNLLGGATGDPDTGIKDAGASVSRLLPAGNLFVEATGEVHRGDSGSLFQSRRRRDVSAVGRLRAHTDITESSNLEVGGSHARSSARRTSGRSPAAAAATGT